MNAAAPYLGLIATLLALYFFALNFRFGSQKKLYKKVAQPAQLPVFFQVCFAQVQAGYIILIQLAIGYLLISTTVGRDIMSLLLSNKNSGLTIFLTGVLLSVYSVAIWIIPWHLVDEKTYQELHKQKAYKVVLRFWGLMSFLIFLVATMAVEEAWENFDGTKYWVLIGTLFVCYWALELSIKNPYQAQSLFFSLFFVFILIQIQRTQAPEKEIGFKLSILLSMFVFWVITGPSPALLVSKAKSLSYQKKGLGSILGTLTDSIGRMFTRVDALLLKLTGFSKEISAETDPFLAGNRFYFRILLLVNALLAIYATFSPQLEPLSPLLFVYGGMGFLLSLTDLMFFTGKRLVSEAMYNSTQKDPATLKPRQRFVQYLNLTLFVLWVAFVFILFFMGGPGSAEYDLYPRNTPQNRLSIDQYLEDWQKDRTDSIQAFEHYPVFIIAGQGGGSRAGYWMSSALLHLDTQLRQTYDFDLQSHTLAISAVSGSAPGTVATLAYWEKARLDAASLPAPDQFCQRMYQRNFISSGLAGLFYGSMLRKYLYLPLHHRIANRNTRLCQEESAAIHKALQKKVRFDFLNLGPASKKKQFGWQPFSQLYLLGDSIRTDLPLFFANSTQVQTGKRVLINPLINTQKNPHFANAIDFYQHLDPKKDLAIIQAANMSELFPWISSSAYFPGLGNYVDGAYYENYGLETAMDLYQACLDWQKASKDPLSPKLRFYIISIMNEAPDYSGQNPAIKLEATKPGEGIVPIMTLTKTLFSGHATTALERAKNTLKRDSALHMMVQTRQNLPLTRVLTKYNMLSMDSACHEALEKADVWFKKRVRPVRAKIEADKGLKK
jgi:hypothetical protein